MKSKSLVLDRKSRPAGLVAVMISCAGVLVSQLYYAYNPSFVAATLLFGVVLPLLAGCVLLFLTDQVAILLGFIGIFLSIIDDAPIDFDSVLTWPQVTRLNPSLPHLEMEVLLHILTFGFLMGSIWIRLRGRNPERGLGPLSYAAGCVATVLSYAQNIPLASIQDYVTQNWYQFDAIEHVLSVLSFAIALLLSRKRQE
jgi:hypothetical protein